MDRRKLRGVPVADLNGDQLPNEAESMPVPTEAIVAGRCYRMKTGEVLHVVWRDDFTVRYTPWIGRGWGRDDAASIVWFEEEADAVVDPPPG